MEELVLIKKRDSN